MTKLKALSTLQTRAYTLEKYGPEVAERVRAALSEEIRNALYAEYLMASDWIEVAHTLEQLRAFDRVVGTGDGELAKTLIREVAAQHYKGLYRVALASAPPDVVLEKSSKLWSRFYDKGEAVVTFHGPGHATSRIINCPDLPLGHELLVTPYQEEILRQSGAKHPVATHT